MEMTHDTLVGRLRLTRETIAVLTRELAALEEAVERLAIGEPWETIAARLEMSGVICTRSPERTMEYDVPHVNPVGQITWWSKRPWALGGKG